MYLRVKYFISFFVFHFSFFICAAQWYNPDKVDKKAGQIYGEAYEAAQDGNYTLALQKIEECLKIDPKLVDAYLSRASVYSALKNYSASVKDFEKAIKLDTVYTLNYHLPYSISLAGVGKFDEALKAINKFLSISTLNEQSKKAGAYRKSTFEFAIKQQGKNAHTNFLFAPKNLGDSINTKRLEYFPSFTVDGKKLIFTRRLDDEDFYESDLIDNVWTKAKPLQGKVNTNLNEGAQCISLDGSLLVFTGCNYPEGEGSCDLYYSLKTKNGWSEPQNLGRGVNTEFWESSPSISPDKQIIYFSSNRPNGFGGKDIWAVFLLQNGKYGNAQNLGEAVNTSGDESSPFMHADNESLYFNSNGHLGYGMTDIFRIKRLTDSTWLLAENLGYPINTIDDEGSLVVAANASSAYYASDRSDTKGGLDIYSFELPTFVKPIKTLWVKGKVYDAKTKLSLPSTVELTDVDNKRLISKIKTDEEGNYLVTLPIGKNYFFNVNRKGYLFYSDNFSLTNTTDSIATKDIPLQPIEVGAAITLNNIFFDTKQSTLKPNSILELDKVVQLLTDNSTIKIQISGHTDNVGKPKDNLLLSDSRAKAVVNYLIQKGITSARLTSKGFGATKPIADNKIEQGKALNRRTELSVLSK